MAALLPMFRHAMRSGPLKVVIIKLIRRAATLSALMCRGTRDAPMSKLEIQWLLAASTLAL